jgi:hypothetical protein
MKILTALIIIGVMALWIPFKMDQRYAQGLADGKASALKVNPVSEELELVCAGLWVGKQGAKSVTR